MKKIALVLTLAWIGVFTAAPAMAADTNQCPAPVTVLVRNCSCIQSDQSYTATLQVLKSDGSFASYDLEANRENQMSSEDCQLLISQSPFCK